MSARSPRRLPRWLKQKVPLGNANHFTAGVVRELGLATVCDHARCPNRMECYAQKTATFMILGEVCTRGCAFCSVAKGRPSPLDPLSVDDDEPRRVALAVERLGLRHVVITSVTRDDLPDGGCEHFCRTINAIRDLNIPAGTPTIEVLPSDFGGNVQTIDRLISAVPEVYNHNVETVPRLYPSVRGRASNYRRTLAVFRQITDRDRSIKTKTGMMLGLGETTDEILDTLAELHAAGCRMLTLGQYLQPSPRQVPVTRYVPPEEFETLGEAARRIGFEAVASAPLVRSSYHARGMLAGE
jgi:lipoic acid synthetase